jgi:epsin
LAELLSDSEKIRVERRKSKQTKSKYTGVGSDESGFGGSGKKYGGFGSEDLSFGSYSGQVYGNFSLEFVGNGRRRWRIFFIRVFWER